MRWKRRNFWGLVWKGRWVRKMAKNIKVKWGKPRRLVKCPEKIRLGFIMKFRGEHERVLENITNGPGVYFFARKHGRTYKNTLLPLYVGRAKNVRRRIKQHFNSVKLMTRIRDAATGGRVLVVGTIERDAERSGVIVERVLIKKAMADGCNLINKQGTRIKADSIQFSGNLSARNTFGAKIYAPRR